MLTFHFGRHRLFTCEIDRQRQCDVTQRVVGVRHFDLDVLRLSCRAICVRRVLPLYPTDVKAEPAFDGRIVYCTVRSQRFVNKAVRDVVLVSAQFRALQQRFTLANGFLAILSR